MDRALMTRLMLPPSPELQSPVFYLLDVYSRASDELRVAYKDAATGARMHDLAAFAQELAVSHMHLTLVMDMFPQVRHRSPFQTSLLLAGWHLKHFFSSHSSHTSPVLQCLDLSSTVAVLR